MTISEYDRGVDLYSDNLYRFVLKSLRDEEQAKDVVQESFLRLWENREAVISGKEKGYLFTIAYRLMVDQIRMRRRYVGGEQMLVNRKSPQRGEFNNLSETIERYLDRLPPIQKALIMLRDYEGYSYREMAEMTALSESQVKVYIFRARVALKKYTGDINDIL